MIKRSLFTLTVLLLSVCLTSFYSSALDFDFELPEDANVLIEHGQTVWDYTTMTLEEFEEISDVWYTGKEYESLLERQYSGSFGNRIEDGNHVITEWRSFSSVLLLRTTFVLPDLKSAEGSRLYALFFYDNTVNVYINDQPVFSDPYWVDGVVLTVFDAAGALKEGENTIEISVADDGGGREFALTLFTSAEEIEPPDVPADPGTDDPGTDDPGDDIPPEQTEPDGQIRKSPLAGKVTEPSGEKPVTVIETADVETVSGISQTAGIIIISVSGVIGAILILTGAIFLASSYGKPKNKEQDG